MAELIQPRSHIRQTQTQLMQNCDLPPPTKLCFSTAHLAEALHRSQKRARESERRMEEAIEDSAYAINALVSESMKVMAYRRWVMMMEIQLHKMKLKTAEEDAAATPRMRIPEAAEDDDVDGGEEKWEVGLVFCLGLAGLGFALTFAFLR